MAEKGLPQPTPPLSKPRTLTVVQYLRCVFVELLVTAEFGVLSLRLIFMEGLGVAANVIAVVDISYKVICSCLQYAQDVRHAKTEKSRLSEAVINLNLTLRSAQELLGGPRGERLKKSQSLFSAVQNSESRLQSLNHLLSPKPSVGKDQSISAWKWPFKRNEVDTHISDLQHCSAAVNLALQIDQTFVLILRQCRIKI